MVLYKNVNGIRSALSAEEEKTLLEERAATTARRAANKWLRERISEYPKISDQLDMLWHELDDKGSIDSDGEWYRTIKDVKDSHPKPDV